MKKLLLFLLLPVAVTAQSNHAALIAQFMRGQHDYFKFNGNVLVAEKGKIIYQQPLGYADYNTKRMLDNNSVFELASLSKQFTAMGILICQDKGLLNINDRVIKFFPLFPYQEITIRELLTHTSGLPGYEEQFEKDWDHKQIAYNKDIFSMLDREHDTLFFKPGTRWKYSNTGYAILASVIEKASKKTYAEFMKENIFKPLGMAHTFVYNSRRSSKKIPENYALGFVYSDSLHRYIIPDSLSKFDYVYYLDGIVGDGCVNSTTGDLFKWDRALYGNKLVSKALLDEMLSPQVLMSPRDSSSYYGYGVMVQPKTEKGKMITHSGGWPGYATFITRFPDSNQVIIILSNNESAVAQFDAGLKSILANDPLLMPYEHKRISIDTSTLDKFAGKYSAFLTLTFIKKDGKLFRHRQGTPDIELIPESPTKFFYGDVTDRQIEFELGANGNVTKAWFINTGQKGELKKIQ